MEILEIELKHLKENNYNFNVMEPDKFEALVRNIKEKGAMLQPICVRPLAEGDYQIIDGAHRKRASEQAGLQKILCVVCNSPDDEAKLSTISFNSLRGTSDPVKMRALLEDLLKTNDVNSIMKKTGFTQFDMYKHLGQVINAPAAVGDVEAYKKMLIAQGMNEKQAQAMAEIWAFKPIRPEASSICGVLRAERVMLTFFFDREEDAIGVKEFFKMAKGQELNTEKLIAIVRGGNL